MPATAQPRPQPATGQPGVVPRRNYLRCAAPQCAGTILGEFGPNQTFVPAAGVQVVIQLGRRAGHHVGHVVCWRCHTTRRLERR